LTKSRRAQRSLAVKPGVFSALGPRAKRLAFFPILGMRSNIACRAKTNREREVRGVKPFRPNTCLRIMTELGAEIERKMKEYSLLCNESETLRRLAHYRAHKMSKEEVLNWLGVIYELLKRYSTLMREL
jgi:hypothetical protein